MNRFDRSCIRAFFTLPPALVNYPNTKVTTEYNRPFNSALRTAGSIVKDNIIYYIIWMDDPVKIPDKGRIDLSFRDFSFHGIVPVVLIRHNQYLQPR